MQIHILGSCSGTEPVPGRDYTSWILEEDNGGLLWFDAGGECASHAYVKGLSPLKVRAFFLSHPHLDHTAGLPGIFQVIRKEKWLRQEHEFRKLHCYTSVPEVITAADTFLKADAAGPGDEWDFTPVVKELHPGEVYRDGETAVEALPNRHMPPCPRSGKPRSYSFRLNCKGKCIVYTGDVGTIDELGMWLRQPTALLMLETGHHRAAQLCSVVRERRWKVEHLLFLHHGLEIIRDPAGEKARADAAWGKGVIFAGDGMALPFW